MFAIGHSMGGAILLTTVVRTMKQPLFQGIILSSPACCAHVDPLYSDALRNVGYYVNKVLPKAHLVYLPPDKISRNKDANLAYQQDPLIYHGLLPVSTAFGLEQVHVIFLRCLFLTDVGRKETLGFI